MSDRRPSPILETRCVVPIQAGELKIGTARWNVDHGMGGRVRTGFFDRFFFAMAAPQPSQVNTDPLTLQADQCPRKTRDSPASSGIACRRSAADAESQSRRGVVR